MKTANSNRSDRPQSSDGGHPNRTPGLPAPQTPRQAGRLCLLFLFCLSSFGLSAAESARVKLVRTPDGGIQPQAAVDSQGVVVHLIYYKGEAARGDIFYVRQEPDGETFSNPIPVNSRRGSAIAAGTIRGAQLAVGKNGRVHVVWNGTTPTSINGKEAAPLLYTRLNDSGSAFEPEGNLITYASGLDGGSSVAADTQGNVFVAWHASPPGNVNGEAGRAVFVARSNDEGKTFGRETPAISKPTGACACCGMRAFADSSGAAYILFRAASEMVNRDEILLVSRKPGAAFEIAYAHPWKVVWCPMSSAALTEAKGGVLAAWETAGQVYFASVNANTMQVSNPVAPPGSAKRKHPVAVANVRGETLLVWTEDTGWAKGGAVAWQVYDKAGNPSSERGRADGVPAWSLVTAYAKHDGSFVIVY